MIVLDINLDGDVVGDDLRRLQARQYFQNPNEPIRMTALEGGLQSGKPSVAFRFNLEKDVVLVVESSLSLFLTAAELFVGKFGDPRMASITVGPPRLKLDLAPGRGDGAWPDLVGKVVIHQVWDLRLTAVSGEIMPTIVFSALASDDILAIAKTELSTLLDVADELRERFGDPRQ